MRWRGGGGERGKINTHNRKVREEREKVIEREPTEREKERERVCEKKRDSRQVYKHTQTLAYIQHDATHPPIITT